MITRSVIMTWVIAAVASAAVAQRPTRVVIQTNQEDAQRSGWIGVTFRQAEDGQRDGAKGKERPVIVSVTPGSPAQEAGLVAGDTVLSFNNADAVKEPHALEHMLRPGNRIVVRVRRDAVREIPVTVGVRPGSAGVSMRVEFDGSSVPMPVEVDGIQGILRLGSMGFPIGPGVCGDTPVAGASVVSLTSDLADALRLSGSGVLITSVAPGTPAMTSGLKSGDIIVSVDTIHIADPASIVKIMQVKSSSSRTAARTMLLDVRRKGKARKVTLRW